MADSSGTTLMDLITLDPSPAAASAPQPSSSSSSSAAASAPIPSGKQGHSEKKSKRGTLMQIHSDTISAAKAALNPVRANRSKRESLFLLHNLQGVFMNLQLHLIRKAPRNNWSIMCSLCGQAAVITPRKVTLGIGACLIKAVAAAKHHTIIATESRKFSLGAPTERVSLGIHPLTLNQHLVE